MRETVPKRAQATNMSGTYPKLKADINHIIVLSCVYKLDLHELDADDPSENFLSFYDSFWPLSKDENLDEAYTYNCVWSISLFQSQLNGYTITYRFIHLVNGKDLLCARNDTRKQRTSLVEAIKHVYKKEKTHTQTLTYFFTYTQL